MYVARALTGSMSDQRNVVCGIDSCIDSWIGCVRSVSDYDPIFIIIYNYLFHSFIISYQGPYIILVHIIV